MPPLEIIDQGDVLLYAESVRPLACTEATSATAGYFIAGTRVSLDSVVYAFLRGESPEGIAESFPVLGLEQIFGVLALYMANREIVDHYLSEGQRDPRSSVVHAPVRAEFGC